MLVQTGLVRLTVWYEDEDLIEIKEEVIKYCGINACHPLYSDDQEKLFLGYEFIISKSAYDVLAKQFHLLDWNHAKEKT